jgi:hypothetical protein
LGLRAPLYRAFIYVGHCSFRGEAVVFFFIPHGKSRGFIRAIGFKVQLPTVFREKVFELLVMEAVKRDVVLSSVT